jgi:hypothetical protein
VQLVSLAARDIEAIAVAGARLIKLDHLERRLILNDDDVPMAKGKRLNHIIIKGLGMGPRPPIGADQIPSVANLRILERVLVGGDCRGVADSHC